jgi:hypothetical protein
MKGKRSVAACSLRVLFSQPIRIVTTFPQAGPCVKVTVVNVLTRNWLPRLPQKLMVEAVPGWTNVTTVIVVTPVDPWIVVI